MLPIRQRGKRIALLFLIRRARRDSHADRRTALLQRAGRHRGGRLGAGRAIFFKQLVGNAERLRLDAIRTGRHTVGQHLRSCFKHFAKQAARTGFGDRNGKPRAAQRISRLGGQALGVDAVSRLPKPARNLADDRLAQGGSRAFILGARRYAHLIFSALWINGHRRVLRA